jgi:hypothetical protein
MLARQNGWLECAELLRGWPLDKDKALREREVPFASSLSNAPETVSRRRLHVKRSIDNAFIKLKSDPHLKVPINTSPPSSASYPDSPAPLPTSPEDIVVPAPNPVSEISKRLSPPPHMYITVPPRVSSSLASPQRPRSAGTGADFPQHPSSHLRKLGTKYSLLHMFKKSQATSDLLVSGASPTIDFGHPYVQASSFASASSSALPIEVPQAKMLSTSPDEVPLSPSSLGDYPSRSSSSQYVIDGHTHGKGFLGVVDMPRTKPHQHTRVRSSSGISTDGGYDGNDARIHAVLRSHNRSSSQGQPHPQFGPSSMLRFDSSSSSNLRSGAKQLWQDSGTSTSPSPSGRLKSSRSSHSLRHADTIVLNVPPASTTISDNIRIDVVLGDEDEEEYGIPVEHPRFTTGDHGSPRIHSPSSSSSSLSQAIAGDLIATPSEPEVTSSIMPLSSELDGRLLDIPPKNAGHDNRSRGDSISSLSTDGSVNPRLTYSTMGTSKSKTPANTETYLNDSSSSSPTSKPHDLRPPELGLTADDSVVFPHRLGLGQKRSHTPLDIDIRSISSHAQAEALVQLAQQSIFEMADQFTPSVEPNSAVLSSGRSPLSARLAAYGESLAIERKLRQEEEEKDMKGTIRNGDNGHRYEIAELMDKRRHLETTKSDLTEATSPEPSGPFPMDAQSSLENKSSPTLRLISRDPKMPSTGGGNETEPGEYCFFTVSCCLFNLISL